MSRIGRRLISVCVAGMLSVSAAQAQTVIKPGFNIFTPDQDVEIGRQSAIQVEKQMPLVSDAAASRYVSSLGARLAAQAPGPRFSYQFKVVNLSDVNAFALPGGFIYVHRGLLEHVRTEGELAGVLSHEIAHVALRHPTNQASKAYLAQAGLGILGGLFGQGHSSARQVIGAVGGFGLNTLFLKFSRSIESQADIAGTQIMDRAGYDPMEMAHFFHFLGQQAGGNPGRFAVFMSNHPAPADREARVEQEARLLGTPRPSPPLGDLAFIQSRMRRLPPAPSMAQLAQAQTAPAGSSVPASTGGLTIERPSTTFRLVQQPRGVFQIERPDNWTAYLSSADYGVTIVPRGGVKKTANGRNHITHGVIVNHYVPFEGSMRASFPDAGRNTSLADATDDLIQHIQAANPYLRRVAGSESRHTLAGAPALLVTLAGRSADSGVDERVSLVTRELPDGHIVFMLLIAPSDEYADLAPTFDRMIGSFQADPHATHD